MRRIGPRGSGRFERISSDEAMDHVAREMVRIRTLYGNAAFLDASRSGNTSMLSGFGMSKRFFYKLGGCTELWSNMSAEAEVFSVRITFGARADYKTSGPRADRLCEFEADPDVWLGARSTARSAPARHST